MFQFFKTQGVLDFCLLKCNYHPLERLCCIPWAAKFLKLGRWTCDSSRNKSMYYFTDHSEVERTHKESSSPGNGPGGIRAVPWVSLAPLWAAEPTSGQELGLSHVCSYSTPTSINLKLLWKHRNWELQFLTMGLGFILNIKKKINCCTPRCHEILPCQALHPYPGFHWKKTQVCRQGSKKFLTEIRNQENANAAWHGSLELPWGQQDSTGTQNPDGENLLQSQSWFSVFSDVIIFL